MSEKITLNFIFFHVLINVLFSFLNLPAPAAEPAPHCHVTTYPDSAEAQAQPLGTISWDGQENLAVRVHPSRRQPRQYWIALNDPLISDLYASWKRDPKDEAVMPLDTGKDAYKLSFRRRVQPNPHYLARLSGPACTEIFNSLYRMQKDDPARLKWEAFLSGVIYLMRENKIRFSPEFEVFSE